MVAGERRQRIVARLVANGHSELGSRRLCEVCAEVTGMSGAGIMLVTADVRRGSLCATNEVSALIEQLQYLLGEGPCLDAHHRGLPVVEPNLLDPSASRWIAFAGPAVEAGVRAIFGFPIHVGSIRLGALNLYRDRPGRLTDEQYADALVLADVAAQAVLLMQANAPSDMLAVELESGSDFQYVVHQASGMVSVQLGVGIGQALVRLRAYAFGSDRSLTEVAKSVVARTLRFDPTRDDGGADS